MDTTQFEFDDSFVRLLEEDGSGPNFGSSKLLEEEDDILNVASFSQPQLPSAFSSFDLNAFTQKLHSQVTQINGSNSINNNHANASVAQQPFEMQMFEQFFKSQFPSFPAMQNNFPVQQDQTPLVSFLPPSVEEQQQESQQVSKKPQKPMRHKAAVAATATTQESPSLEESSSLSSSSSPSPQSASPSSCANSPQQSSDEKQPQQVRSEDVKRQKRLIKNRESAQASRERKKAYLQGLEKKVNDLSSHNNSLMHRLMLMEEENGRLRHSLKRMERGDQIHFSDSKDQEDGAQTKRRKMSHPIKLPLPRNATAPPSVLVPQGSTPTIAFSPFSQQFWQMMWSKFSNGTPTVITPQLSNANGMGQQNAMAVQQPIANGWPQLPAKGIVLFLMVFCIAFLVGTGSNGSQHNISSPSLANNDGRYESRHVGRKILNTHVQQQQPPLSAASTQSDTIALEKDTPLIPQPQQLLKDKITQHEFASKLKQLYEQFEQIQLDEGLKPSQSPVSTPASQNQSARRVDEDLLNFRVHIDKEQQNLVLTLPVQQESYSSEQSNDKSIFSISKKIVKEICNYLQN